MKKLIVSSLSVIALAILGTGCLKDKGFENQDYGTQVQDSHAVSFPQAATGASPISFGLNSQNEPQDIVAPVIALETPNVLSTDVHVTLQSNPALLAAYPDLTELPADQFVLPTSATIQAGQRFDTLRINLISSAVLDPLLTYAIGVSLVSADGGLDVVSNQKDVVISFSLKNMYDGIYVISGTAVRGGDPVLSGPFGPYERELVTSGANSVQWNGTIPWANGSGTQLPAGYEPNITIDPVTNLVTSLDSPNGLITMNTSTGYAQYYDPITRTIYFEFAYASSAARLFTFQAVWDRPRP